MKKFRSKEEGSTELLEAIQFTGDNSADVIALCPTATVGGRRKNFMKIQTEDGEVTAEKGEWILKKPADPAIEGSTEAFEVYDSEGFKELFDEIDENGAVVAPAPPVPSKEEEKTDKTTSQSVASHDHKWARNTNNNNVHCTVDGCTSEETR